MTTPYLLHPVPGARATDGYAWRAAIAGVVAAGWHRAQDYAAPAGTPIRAAHSGTVTRDTYLSDTGNLIWIDSGKGYATGYAHMLERTPLNVGDRVTAGQVIGKVGSTGASTGAHLHFMLEIDGARVDPLPYTHTAPKPSILKDGTMPYYVRLNSQTKVYLVDPVSRRSRAIDTWEWNTIKAAYGAANLGIPVVNVSSSTLKKLTGKTR